MKMKVLFTLLLIAITFAGMSQTPTRVLVLEIRDEIDPRMNRYVKLGLEKATQEKHDIVVIDMDTYGGLVTDAKDIVEMLLDFPRPVWVFINKDAASAGALISIACDSIYMSSGASIGAATVVMGEGEAAPDKYQSYMRSTMRSTAEVNGRDPKIAEAMVDQEIEIEGITEKGQVITFSTSEAIKYGFCEAKVESVEELLERNGIKNANVERFGLGFTEKIIAWVLNPFVSGILILVIIGGIYFELQTPGVGFPLVAAVIALIIYLIPYYLNGLAESWEIIAFILGVALIAAEIFVIPGFGVAGISGIILTMGSLILIMLDNNTFDFTMVPMGRFITAGLVTLGGIGGAIVVMFIGGVKFTDSRFFQRIALTATQSKEEGFTASFIPKNQMKGKRGVAYTVLRPSGKIDIDGEIYDAFTRGEYVEKGEKVIVIGDETTGLKVKRED